MVNYVLWVLMDVMAPLTMFTYFAWIECDVSKCLIYAYQANVYDSLLCENYGFGG